MYLYFKNSKGKLKLISESEDKTELIKEMVKMCENNNFKIFYTRIIQISDNLEQYDVGSWSEFFYISKTPMTERSID